RSLRRRLRRRLIGDRSSRGGSRGFEEMSMSFQQQALGYAPPSPSHQEVALQFRTVTTLVIALAALGFALRATAIFALHRWQQPNAIEHRALALSLVENGTFYFRDFGKF